jgi:hypothetical protein
METIGTRRLPGRRPEVHQVLLGKVFPRQAEVTTIADWAERLH